MPASSRSWRNAVGYCRREKPSVKTNRCAGRQSAPIHTRRWPKSTCAGVRLLPRLGLEADRRAQPCTLREPERPDKPPHDRWRAGEPRLDELAMQDGRVVLHFRRAVAQPGRIGIEHRGLRPGRPLAVPAPRPPRPNRLGIHPVLAREADHRLATPQPREHFLDALFLAHTRLRRLIGYRRRYKSLVVRCHTPSSGRG